MIPRVPPIKIQGIKTKLIPSILNIIPKRYDTWVEPFLGSGVVAFNESPYRAILSDTNPHIINFYRNLQSGKITYGIVREYLEKEGRHLSDKGESHYYEIRDRFNESFESLDFLFLNRSCFNGLMRFNGKCKFNVPFCRNPNRFSPGYITKITNQVAYAQSILYRSKYVIQNTQWEETAQDLKSGDFLYLDPPYIGRNANYYDSWNEYNMDRLVSFLKSTESSFCLSMWYENKYRKNEYVDKLSEFDIQKHEHFYHVGNTENLRNSMIEALVVKV